MQNQSLWKGACAGLISGLAAAWIMNRFQSGLSSAEKAFQKSSENGAGEQDEPATAKAAESISENAFGHELTPQEKKVAAPAAHYVMGGVSGAIYGAAAQVFPAVAVGGGTLFGACVWLLADELAVPAFGFSKKPTEYPAQTHWNALAAHLVYGAATHLGYRTMLRLPETQAGVLRKAAILGAVSGLRSMTGPFLLSRIAQNTLRRQTHFDGIRSHAVRTALAVMTAGEIVADKLPNIPDRIKPASLGFRAASGGLCGAAVFAAEGSEALTGAVIGATCAIGGAFGGYYLRRASVKHGVPDLVYAIGEDATALSARLALR